MIASLGDPTRLGSDIASYFTCDESRGTGWFLRGVTRGLEKIAMVISFYVLFLFPSSLYYPSISALRSYLVVLPVLVSSFFQTTRISLFDTVKSIEEETKYLGTQVDVLLGPSTSKGRGWSGVYACTNYDFFFFFFLCVISFHFHQHWPGGSLPT